MSQVTLYSEKEVEELAERYSSRIWMAGFIEYAFLSAMTDALIAIFPPAAFLTLGNLLEETIPQYKTNSRSLAQAREILLHQSGKLTKEQVERRRAFLTALEKHLGKIPQKERPLIGFNNKMGANAYYWGAGHVLVFSPSMIDEFEAGDAAIDFLINHELGHCVLKHSETTYLTYFAKVSTVMTAGVAASLLFSLPAGVAAGVGIGALFNYQIHNLSIQHEYEADEYAVTTLKSAAGAKRIFAYFIIKNGSLFIRFLEQGFTEEQAFRLANAIERGSFSHPSKWDRLKRAEALEKQLSQPCGEKLANASELSPASSAISV